VLCMGPGRPGPSDVAWAAGRLSGDVGLLLCVWRGRGSFCGQLSIAVSIDASPAGSGSVRRLRFGWRTSQSALLSGAGGRARPGLWCDCGLDGAVRENGPPARGSAARRRPAPSPERQGGDVLCSGSASRRSAACRRSPNAGRRGRRLLGRRVAYMARARGPAASRVGRQAAVSSAPPSSLLPVAA